MSTSYNDIYSLFLDKVNDYEIDKLIDDGETDTVDAMQLSYLKSSIVKFYRYCKNDLTDRNDTTLVFTNTLTLEEQEILAIGMIIAWLQPHINRLQLLKQVVGSEFKLSSQANQLKELRQLKESVKKDLDEMITEYGYNYYSSDTLKTLLND